MNTDEIIYQLTVRDLQAVANDELGRELTTKEVELLRDKIGDYINWYNAIANTITFNVTKDATN
ncbi:MAG: hypothetical protein LBF81_03535 [Prevotellaceae bacterium]|jgi:hypothetical protein|nr:hypothetical protein [Prevotellaceae bacterium]